MQFAVVGGRSQIVRDGHAYDVHLHSAGAYGPDPITVLDQWEEFRAWAESATLDAEQATPFDSEHADSPVPFPRQVFGIGLNYRAHQIESGLPATEVPLVFTKFPTSVTGPHGDVELPTDRVDWEVEAAVIIGRHAHRVQRSDAWDYVAGVTASQDFSARDVQMRPAGTPQFSLGKSFPGFTPMGPVLITPDELSNRDDIPVACWINDDEVQRSTTADLIFDVPELIEYLSGIVPLLPGDVILTGTPSGVGLGQTPQRFLTAGDIITTEVAGMTMRHKAVLATEVGDRA